MGKPKSIVKRAKDGTYYWLASGGNGEPQAHGEPVATHQMHRGDHDAERSADAMLRAAADVMRQRGWTVEEPKP